MKLSVKDPCGKVEVFDNVDSWSFAFLRQQVVRRFSLNRYFIFLHCWNCCVAFLLILFSMVFMFRHLLVHNFSIDKQKGALLSKEKKLF